MVKKALRYVQGTKGLMLTYRKSDSLGIEGYSDADFVGDIDDQKSMSGYVFTLAGGYMVKKLQTKCHCVINDVRGIRSML